MHPRGLEANLIPGQCVACGRALAPRNGAPRRVSCGGPCRALYLKLRTRDQYLTHPERYGTEFYKRKRALKRA